MYKKAEHQLKVYISFYAVILRKKKDNPCDFIILITAYQGIPFKSQKEKRRLSVLLIQFETGLDKLAEHPFLTNTN